jgi:paraquat-inducible protein B
MANPLRKLQNLRSAWYVWLFPSFAVMICIWLFFDYVDQKGPVIQIRFDDGSSLQPEKTRVRFRGVTIGMVKKVSVSDDDKEVIAEVSLQKEATHFATEGSKFWVVMPKVNFQGISGLETIFEGTYIAALPGKKGGSLQHDFRGKLTSESNESLEDTVAYYLETGNVDSINAGDSVTFRGLKVGSVTKVTLTKSAQTAVVQINVQNKYAKLIRSNTVFWRKLGVQANLGLFKSEVKINSLDSLLRGGIDFFTPDQVGEIAKAQSKFVLNQEPPKDWNKWNPKLD